MFTMHYTDLAYTQDWPDEILLLKGSHEQTWGRRCTESKTQKKKSIAHHAKNALPTGKNEGVSNSSSVVRGGFSSEIENQVTVDVRVDRTKYRAVIK